MGFGRTVIQMRNLPSVCQNEWIRLLTSSLQRVISTANQQVARTKDRLKLTNGKGILLLANDGNVSLDPYNLVVLVSHVLKKLHPDGSPQYSSIEAVAFFSVNLLISSPLSATPAIWWFNGCRPFCRQEVKLVLDSLEKGWYKLLSERVGYQIPRVKLAENALEEVTFFKPQ
jgi:hypothetical protein